MGMYREIEDLMNEVGIKSIKFADNGVLSSISYIEVELHNGDIFVFDSGEDYGIPFISVEKMLKK